MLRRSAKRQATGKIKKISKESRSTQRHSKSKLVLGDRSAKDEAERVLEKVVLGGGEDILQKLEESSQPSHKKRKKKSKAALEGPKPAWEDDDEVTGTVKLSSKDFRHKYFKHHTEPEVTGEKYTQTLKTQFEKISGTPSWAKLKWEKSDSEDDGSDDEETRRLIQTTGNYLASSQALPKGTIQMNKCPDANQECPSQGKLKSVEFHPTAQVALAAGMNHTLNLFQIDGKTNPKIQSVFLEKFPIYTAHFNVEGSEVVMGSTHKQFYYYDMIAGKIVKVPWIKGLEENNMSRFVMSPDGSFIVFLGSYGNIHLVSAKSKEWIHSLKMNGTVDAVTFTQDGSQMYSHGGDGEVYIWDMRRRDCIHRFTDDGCIQGTAMAMSRSGNYLATGSYSGVVNIYDQSCQTSRTPRPLKALMNLTTPCTKLVFNSTEEVLAMSSNYAESAVKLVHMPSLSVFSNFPNKADGIRIPYCIDFSLRSGYFMVGNHKGNALLYRVKHYSDY